MRQRMIAWLTVVGLGIAAHSASAELIAFWQLDEGEGAEAVDGTGNGFNGIIENDVEWTDGKFGSALQFINGWVRVPHAAELDFESWSISVWVKIDNATGTYQMIAGKEGWPNRNYSMWVLPTVVTFGFTSGANDVQMQGGDVVNDEWRHIVGTYDGEFLRAYIDGAFVKQQGAAGDPNTCACPFFIGSQPPGGGGPTVGAIDEVAIFSHAVDEDEVAELFAGLTPLAVELKGKSTVAWGDLKRASF
ncbi:MAG: LamG domain-containing protein [Candidatus Poribacteria bacterium]|nr:LamG domain-containing protein [Candidatus Poribacteria bacterium]